MILSTMKSDKNTLELERGDDYEAVYKKDATVFAP